MKQKSLLFFLLVLLITPVYQGCNKDSEEQSEAVTSYNQSVAVVAVSLKDFVMKSQTYESTNYDVLTGEQTLAIINAFIASGEKLIADVNTMQANKATTKHSGGLKSTNESPCSVYDAIPGTDSGLSPGFMKSIGDLIAETKGEVSKLQEKLNKGEITEDQYDAAIKQLTKMKTVKTANFGVSAVLGAGAGGLTGAAIYSVGGIGLAMSTPAIVTVTAVGAVVGTGYYVISNWYYGVQKNGLEEQNQYIVMATGKVGDPIPSTLLKDGANLTIVVDGYAPVYIPSFSLPAQGNKKTLELKSKPVSEAAMSDKIEVCTMEEPYTTNNCSEVLYITGRPYPTDPGPGEGVTVTATMFPAVEGCEISFSIVGTDGYTNSATNPANASGEASFYIPGGAAGVYDIVTITTASGLTYTVTYTF